MELYQICISFMQIQLDLLFEKGVGREVTTALLSVDFHGMMLTLDLDVGFLCSVPPKNTQQLPVGQTEDVDTMFVLAMEEELWSVVY